MDEKLKKTLKCMIIGTSIYNIILLVVSTIFFIFYYKSVDNAFILIVKNELCLIIGYILSIAGLYSIASSIAKAVGSNDQNYAKKHMTLMSSIRFLVFCIVLIILINKNVCGVSGGIMYALATLGIKVGAYLAPTIEKKIFS